MVPDPEPEHPGDHRGRCRSSGYVPDQRTYRWRNRGDDHRHRVLERDGRHFGGTAGTSFQVLPPIKVRVTTPANTAGAKAFVVQDPDGDATQAGWFTYA